MPQTSQSASPEREVVFQQDLCFQLQGLIAEKPGIRSVRFEEARMEFPAGAGRADIAVLRVGGGPFLIIETKRKGGRVSTDIDPWDPHVIQQAIGYAALAGAPYFATANRGYLAAFRTPNRGEKFEIPRHRVFATTIQALDRKFVSELLVRLVDYELATTETDRAQIATPLDWTFVYRLRSFVDWLSRRAEPAVRQLFTGSPEFADRLRKFEKERGTQLSAKRLAREMVYVLANKILFYKALERRFNALDRLDLSGARDVAEIQERLSRAFKHATVVTHDFEAIFSTDLYDDIALEATSSELTPLAEGLQGFINDMEEYKLEKLESDIIGYVYENLIPDAERHELGQFYTPPAVAELIVRWSVRSGDDRVFDPSAGSGTFLVKAYQRLREFKLRGGLRESPAKLHRDLLSQLYSNDVDPFAVHLTAMNLALRDVRHPVTEVNIYETDFFHLAAGSALGSEAEGRLKRVPPVQVVLGNPPYTRWTELTDTTRVAVGKQLNKTLRKYALVAQIRGGVETAIYQHFVIHGTSFVTEGGRLGMIISNSWLQTDVGVKFGAFLLDNFRVCAIIDFSSRLFEVPLVATAVILLERCSSAGTRESNRTVFASVRQAVEVDELISLVKNPGDFSARADVHVVEQKELRVVGKWIGALFGFARLDKKIREKTIPLKDLFKVTRGTIRYSAEQKRGLGANSFFYLTQQQVDQRALSEFTYPTLPGARGLGHFEFSRADWSALKEGGKEVYLFNCRRPRSEVSGPALDYIKWGETDCRARDGKTVCSKSSSCIERARKSGYVGWYDLGGIKPCDMFTTRYSQYRHRFVLSEVELALDDDFIAIRPLQPWSKLQKKAALAALNSTLGQLYIERQGRNTGGGMVSLEVGQAEELRVPPILDLSVGVVRDLATAFDALEAAARTAGGARNRESDLTMSQAYDQLDGVVARALDLSTRDMTEMKQLTEALKERRMARTEESRPESIRGEDQPREDLRPPKRRRGSSGPPAVTRRLDEFPT